MKRHLFSLLIKAICVAAIGFVCSCTDVDEPIISTRPAGVVTEIEVEPDRVKSGDVCDVHITVRNYNSETLSLEFDSDERFGFLVYLDGGTISWYPEYVELGENELVLEPGKSIRVTLPLDTNLSQDDWFGLSGGKLEPGKYTIKAGIREHEYIYPWPKTAFTVTR